MSPFKLYRNIRAFFRPAIGIIYAIFVVIYLAFSFLSRKQRRSSREYQINTLNQFKEAIAQDMDPHEKQQAHDLLAQANQNSHITRQLQKMLDGVKTVKPDPHNRFERLLAGLDKLYARFWQQRSSHKLVQIFFISEVVLFLLGVLPGFFYNLVLLLVINISISQEQHQLSAYKKPDGS